MRHHFTATSTALLIATTTAQAGTLIYENTSGFNGTRSFTQLQIGDEVTAAAGTARTVTELHLGVDQQGFAGTADLQARLYANDGAQGRPGSLLWESAVMQDVPLTGGNDLIPFDVPDVTVPDTFTWTIQISDTSPVAAGLPHMGPPTVGSSPTHAWFGNGTSWTMLTNPSSPVDFMARVVASEATCPEDITGDGVVNVFDLLAVLDAWGVAAPGEPADLNGDGVVNVFDLLAVLDAWGACP